MKFSLKTLCPNFKKRYPRQFTLNWLCDKKIKILKCSLQRFLSPKVLSFSQLVCDKKNRIFEAGSLIIK